MTAARVQLRPMIRETLLCGVIAMSVLPCRAEAQRVDVAVRALAGLQHLGFEVEFAASRLGVYGRSEGYPLASHRIHTVGMRGWPIGRSGAGFFGHLGISAITCPIAEIGGGSTGCDAETHWTPVIGAGLDLGLGGSGFGAFIEAALWTKDRHLPDVPDWSFAGGFRYALPLNR